MGKKEEKLNDYDGFVEKFKPKKTTDDCYTPPAVYDAVLQYVRETYHIADDVPIVRPFYPGGDYENYDYPEGCVVVDNPPFSIFAKILDFYQARSIRFFLFAPSLTILSTTSRRKGCTAILGDNRIVYHNKAEVNTSFATNMTPELACVSSPKLADAIKKAMNLKTKIVNKTKYPPQVFTIKTARYIRNSDIAIRWSEVVPLSECSRDLRNFFGGGFLLSSSAWQRIEGHLNYNCEAELSPEDIAIIDKLNRCAT